MVRERSREDLVMSAGLRCLKEKLGVTEAGIFVATLKEDDFDYTEWRRDNIWDDMGCEEILVQAAEYERIHPRPRLCSAQTQR
jgi:hypothetical protein